MKLLITNGKGSVLPMVLIAGVVTVGLISYTMSKFENLKNESSRLILKNEESLIREQVKALLSSRRSCKTTFLLADNATNNGKKILNAQPALVIPITKVADQQNNIIFNTQNSYDDKIKIKSLTLKNISTPSGSFSETEPNYGGTPGPKKITTHVRVGSIIIEIENLKTGLVHKDEGKEMKIKFSFRGDALADCYGVNENNTTMLETVKKQCEAHNAVWNETHYECRVRHKPIFSSIDNDSVYCQMDKARVRAQGYGSMSFCPDNTLWGGCIYNNVALARVGSTAAVSGLLPVGVHAFKTKKQVNTSSTEIAAAYMLGGVGAVLTGFMSGWFGWCDDKEYYYCARCGSDGKLTFDLYYYWEEYEKRLKCRKRGGYVGPVCR